MNLKGWTYRVYQEDLGAGMFGPFAAVVDLWREKAGDARFPAWSDFELEDFTGWWGRISLADVHQEPFDIEFALWGTKLTEWWGVDFTRKKMSEVYENRQVNWEKFEGPYFRKLVDDGGIGIIMGDLRALHRGYISVQGIDLPLMRNGRVGQVMSVYRHADDNQDPVSGAKPVWQT